MNRIIKRFFAVLLVIGIVMTSLPIESFAAQKAVELDDDATNLLEVQETGKQEEIDEKKSSETEKTVEDKMEEVSVEDKEMAEDGETLDEEEGLLTEENDPEQQKETLDEALESSDEDQIEENSVDEIEKEYLIEYLMLSQSNVQINEKQQIVVGIGGGETIENATLVYSLIGSEEEFQQEFTDKNEDALLFVIPFEDVSQTGIYQLDSLMFQVEGKTYTEYFAEAEIEACFGMDQEIEIKADAMVDEGLDKAIETEAEIIRIDENGEPVSEVSLEEAIANINEEYSTVFNLEKGGEVIVVLDPGHDNTHAGAQANGLGEEDLNIKIAKYCKEELESYQGVKVYLTRELNGECPYPGTSSGRCNEKRVEFAKSVDADIFISLHNNSAANSSAHGAMVFYPNKNYNSSIGEEGKGIAQKIQDQLVELGLYDRGITIKDSADYKYPDGSTADYYAVIRNSKRVGIPAIIVEHAFLTNVGDVNAFLANDTKLKKLGVSDAKAIASYYDLTKEINVSVGAIKINLLDNDEGQAVMKAENVAPLEKINKVSFAVWSSSDQNDLHWYDVENDGTGNYEATLDIGNHKYHYGKYYVDAYAYDIYGNKHYLGGETCIFTQPKQTVTVEKDELQKNYRITAITGRSKAVEVAVWSQVGGQDDLIWYKARKISTGVYTVDVPISKHKTSGLYYADVYTTKSDGGKKCVGSARFQVEPLSLEKIDIVNRNDQQGTFDVILRGLQSASGVDKVQVPVWSKKDQSDLYWYEAKKQPDGSYAVKFNIANHKYNYGKYYIDVYAIAGNAIRQYMGGKTLIIEMPKTQINVEEDTMQAKYVISATDVWVKGSVKKLQFAVWSKTKGQDDLIWYTATKNVTGEYQVNVPISSHKTTGLYYADAYLIKTDGTKICVGSTRFQVEPLSLEKIDIVNRNDQQGTFDVVLSGLQSASGVDRVQVPVWSKKDQSDLYWYEAKKQPDGSYVAKFNIANHKYNYGRYYVDIYAIAGNSIRQYMGGKIVSIEVPKSTICAKENSSQTNYVLTAKDVWVKGSVKRLQFAVWSKTEGQDDLIWYTATKNATGEYQVNVPIINHKTSGLYYVHVYMTGMENSSDYVGGTTFNVTTPVVESIEISNKNDGTGTFDVVLTGVTSTSGLEKVLVPIWSKKDQSDLHWYTAQKQSNGNYVAQFNIVNHKYNYGKYYVDTYVSTLNGLYQYTGGKTVEMNLPKAKISIVEESKQLTYSLLGSDVGIPGGVKSLKFAVWSQSGWQDDLIWYSAKNTGFGKWYANASIINHKTAGVYYVDAYAVNLSGKSIYLGGTTFQVDSPSVSAVELIDANQMLGTFGVKISGINSVSGIENIEVAVWSKKDQSDLVWYNAQEDSEGNYQVAVDARNHQNNTGKYYADAYLTSKNGIRIYAGGVSCEITNIAGSIGTINSCKIIDGSKDSLTIGMNVELVAGTENIKSVYIVDADLLDGSIVNVLDERSGLSGNVLLEVPVSGRENVNTVLMDGLALATRDVNGNFRLVSEVKPISNPESIAHNKAAVFKGTSKKGLQGITYANYEGGSDIVDARNANTKQTLLNLDLSTVVSATPRAGYTAYSYKGKTYYFSNLNALKKNIQSLNYGYKQYLYGNSGRTPVAVSLCLLLSYNSENSYLIDPAARTPGHSYYMLNVREEHARETLEALFLYLGETFGKSDCYVSNWILGNEINSSRAWNYSGGLDFDTYMECYATAFRMLYTGVKSEKSGNTVSISLDNGWTAAPDTYAGKTTLDTFAQKIQNQNAGIQWSIAYHGYSYPLTKADFWNDYHNTTDDVWTPYISMRNISVLTDYVASLESAYGKSSGSIRVLLTEQGYSYSAGSWNQAMAIARGYYMAEFNDRIDAFIIRAVIDDPEETTGNLYFGLMNRLQDKRTAFYVYEYMDSDLNGFRNTPAQGTVSSGNYGKFDEAKNIVCNTNWGAIIPGFDAGKLAEIK